ncbi:MAG: hypothetical protein ACXVBC_12625 [Bdellovibrionota bacterium]
MRKLISATILGLLLSASAHAAADETVPDDLKATLVHELGALAAGADAPILQHADFYSPVYFTDGYEILGATTIGSEELEVALVFHTSGYLDQALSRKPHTKRVVKKADVHVAVSARKVGRHWHWVKKLKTPFVSAAKAGRYDLDKGLAEALKIPAPTGKFP